jgi:hypothetical protein
MVMATLPMMARTSGLILGLSATHVLRTSNLILVLFALGITARSRPPWLDAADQCIDLILGNLGMARQDAQQPDETSNETSTYVHETSAYH